jgi:predicted ribosome quality control (RQC) complex YloA/Tae2 family protein
LLHTKDIPGSHVILRSENGAYSETALYEAALLAAYYFRRAVVRKSAVITPWRQRQKNTKSNYGKVTYKTTRRCT